MFKHQRHLKCTISVIALKSCNISVRVPKSGISRGGNFPWQFSGLHGNFQECLGHLGQYIFPCVPVVKYPTKEVY